MLYILGACATVGYKDQVRGNGSPWVFLGWGLMGLCLCTFSLCTFSLMDAYLFSVGSVFVLFLFYKADWESL